MLYAHMAEPPPRVSEHRPELPAQLDEVIATAWPRSPPSGRDGRRADARRSTAPSPGGCAPRSRRRGRSRCPRRPASDPPRCRSGRANPSSRRPMTSSLRWRRTRRWRTHAGRPAPGRPAAGREHCAGQAGPDEPGRAGRDSPGRAGRDVPLAGRHRPPARPLPPSEPGRRRARRCRRRLRPAGPPAAATPSPGRPAPPPRATGAGAPGRVAGPDRGRSAARGRAGCDRVPGRPLRVGRQAVRRWPASRGGAAPGPPALVLAPGRNGLRATWPASAG